MKSITVALLVFVFVFVAEFSFSLAARTNKNPRPQQQDVCSLPKKVGPCRARTLRYFFNKKRGQCKEFYYGGCRGNQNNFQSEAECAQKCVKDSPIPQLDGADTCSLPAETGQCRGAFQRYHFDQLLGKCVKFTYGGCDGNSNNFRTKRACVLQCAGARRINRG
ncbi:BPTI/Kunitz domain-containing protein-like isoform X2 [Tubulanus polymorphus]|uniref:BPTI/Kunitz domain-containing protein-like isoform X2 n=1 Tax=Tubulanus polymorphus TaxID=672921 RepID=UPI003DA6BAAE